jgi:hypothetical protein
MPGGFEICRELCGASCRSRQRAYHNSYSVGTYFVGGDLSSSQMSQPPLDPIAGDGISDSTADHQADARPVTEVPLIEAHSMDHQRRTAHAHSAPGRSPKVLRAAHSQRSGQHTLIDHTQADRRARPLRRRAEIIARPARVRIRKRKPWVRLRRRLLGWNVRLLTEELPYLRSARQIGYGADTARIAGGAGRWQRPLGKRPSNGTGRRQTGQTGVIVLTRDLGGSMFLAASVGNCAPADSNDGQAANKKSVQRTRRTVWRISQTRLRTESSVASVAVRLTVSRQLHKAATSCTHICAHSVDICVEARAVTIPECRRGSAKVQTTADLCFAYPDRRRTHEDCGVTSDRTF